MDPYMNDFLSELGLHPTTDRLKEAIQSDLKAKKNVFGNYRLYQIMEAVGDENFSGLLKNTANKRVVKGFVDWPATWQKIVNKPFGNRPDFKQNTLIELEEPTRLPEVSKREPTNMQSLSDRTATYKVKTFEEGFQLNRQDIINDDLGQFMKYPQLFGRAAQKTIDQFVWAFIDENPTLGFDDVALFHATHSNLTTTTPLSTDGLSTLKTKLRKQTPYNSSDLLGYKAEMLIVPPSLEDRAYQIVNATRLAETANNDANPHSKLEILVVPWLTDTGDADTCDWYLAAGPGQAETIQIDFLMGKQEPQTLRAIPNSPDGYDFLSRNMAFKVRYEFGGAPAGFRWIQKADAA